MSAREYYDAYWSVGGFRPLGRINPQLQRLYEQHISADARCLDVGCGDGGTSGPWLSAHAADYVGVDVSATAVAEAVRTGFDARVIDDASALPFSDATFDVVTCIEVLEHLFEPDRAAEEILRVLRPQGVLIATVPNVAYWRRRVELALFGRWNPFGDDLSVKESWRDPHIRFFTQTSLERMLTKSGFSSVAVGGFGGAFLAEFPGVRRVAPPRSGRLYRTLEPAVPSLLSTRLHAIAKKSRQAP